MGAAIHLIMAKGEKTRLLSAIKGWVAFDGSGCWIEDGNSNRIKLEHQSHAYCGEWALALANRICHKYRVLRGGWDSVGKLEDVSLFIKHRPFDIWMSISKKYFKKYEQSHPDAANIQKRELDGYLEARSRFETEAKRLVK
jgi:hypothetical protein